MKKILLLLFFLSSFTGSFAQQSVAPIYLWPGNIPDGPGPQGAEVFSDRGSVTNVSKPRLIVRRPAKPNGAAVLVISGGGYAHIELGNESIPAAAWLQAQGVTTFELVYRLPQEGWSSTAVPFQDAQRAMRIIRSKAAAYGIDPKRIGILGFSAGGHLAGMIAADPARVYYTPVDAADKLSARPDFAGLIYPVITMLPPYNKTHSKKSIVGIDATEAQETAYSVEKQVTVNMPPTFIAQAVDDPISPINNTYLMVAALKAAAIPYEEHVFPSGGHGWGMGRTGTPTIAWPGLFKAWAKSSGFWR